MCDGTGGSETVKYTSACEQRMVSRREDGSEDHGVDVGRCSGRSDLLEHDGKGRGRGSFVRQIWVVVRNCVVRLD